MRLLDCLICIFFKKEKKKKRQNFNSLDFQPKFNYISLHINSIGQVQSLIFPQRSPKINAFLVPQKTRDKGNNRSKSHLTFLVLSDHLLSEVIIQYLSKKNQSSLKFFSSISLNSFLFSKPNEQSELHDPFTLFKTVHKEP